MWKYIVTCLFKFLNHSLKNKLINLDVRDMKGIDTEFIQYLLRFDNGSNFPTLEMME